MQYVYFVSYNHSDGKHFGFGRTEMVLNKKVLSMKEIREMELAIEAGSDFKNVVVLNFQLLHKQG